jgi:cell division protein FtsB
MNKPRLVTLSGNEQPELLGIGTEIVAAIISAAVAIVGTATTAIVSGVQGKRAREAAATQAQVAAQAQANMELEAAQAALEQRNATVQQGYAKMLSTSPVAATITKYGPAIAVVGALGVGVVAMNRRAQ